MKSLSKLIEKGNRDAFDRWTSTPNIATKDGVLVSDTATQEKQKQEFLNGYEQGFKQGEEEGRAAGFKEVQGNANALKSIIQNMATPFASLNEQAEQEFINLAVSMAQHIIRKEIETDPQIIISVVKEVFSLLAADVKSVRINVNPADAVILKENLESDDDYKIKIVEDRSVTRGGCKVTTESSTIDATIEKQFESLTSQISGDADE
ncbi:MAG: hypothetical protein D6B27_08975 [Gammaproteobacteria bacterium]|nr:MAG: hypothetical protein D6B27_08975 [Gammaproteobacteria bacterium]